MQLFNTVDMDTQLRVEGTSRAGKVVGRTVCEARVGRIVCEARYFVVSPQSSRNFGRPFQLIQFNVMEFKLYSTKDEKRGGKLLQILKLLCIHYDVEFWGQWYNFTNRFDFVTYLTLL